jgi:hypothetical protein
MMQMARSWFFRNGPISISMLDQKESKKVISAFL